MGKLKKAGIALGVLTFIMLIASFILSLTALRTVTKRTLRMESDIIRLEEAITDQNRAVLTGHLVTATAYSPRRSETNGDPWETATQTRAKGGRTIAVSRDLLKEHDLRGKRVLIPGLGERVVEDVMHKDKRQSIDVFFESTKEAVRFGRQPVIIIPLE